MQQILDACFNKQPNLSADTGGAMPVSMRDLTNDELEQVSGGVLPLIPLVLPALKWGGAIFGGSVLVSAGKDFHDRYFGADECSM